MPRVAATDRRRQLVAAAYRVISQEGFAAATTRRVCAEAGAPLAAFHYCFASKAELLGELTDQAMRELEAARAGGGVPRGAGPGAPRAGPPRHRGTREGGPGPGAGLMGA